MQLNKYKNRSVAVFGLGKTGLSAINTLINSRAKVYAWDDNEEQIVNTKGIYKECNFIYPKEYNWQEINALILSPGIPLTYPKPHWIVKLARSFGCTIKSDIELFLEAKATNQKVVGVTGTNGKSTTTSLIGHILKSAGKKVDVGGNLGIPVLNLNADAEIYVIELSSFQLELMNGVNVDISVLLNITPDHIDRHGSMENYIAAKLKLINGSKAAVIGCDNEITAGIFEEHLSVSSQRVTLESRKKEEWIPVSATWMTGGYGRVLKNGVSLINNDLFDHGECIHIDNAKINLISNAENVAAAYAVCKLLKIDRSVIINGIKSFSGLKHRNEMLGKIKNVLFVNDSKATNAESSEKAILSYDNIYWIVGGRSKDGGIESLRKYFPRIKKAFLIGESTEAFAATLKNKVSFVECGSLKSAFELAYKEAFNSKEEITILLSPACASFDQWKSFEERGEAFCKMFENLKDSFTITDAI
ncbi:UDP-N-acetylmuramoyl-L-alanine--D-glutamate ligase [Wolbachia endosymbiont (group E) of Neria commutata]|uniref:UDP-N-acetylmuramoyl-L-alanine--D-glutamate ligase n=1 Tax=Wolbachia endosymbiont (group E) of Neria commutata TaxID=3066149 RepID=UPI003133008A